MPQPRSEIRKQQLKAMQESEIQVILFECILAITICAFSGVITMLIKEMFT